MPVWNLTATESKTVDGFILENFPLLVAALFAQRLLDGDVNQDDASDYIIELANIVNSYVIENLSNTVKKEN